MTTQRTGLCRRVVVVAAAAGAAAAGSVILFHHDERTYAETTSTTTIEATTVEAGAVIAVLCSTKLWVFYYPRTVPRQVKVSMDLTSHFVLTHRRHPAVLVPV